MDSSPVATAGILGKHSHVAIGLFPGGVEDAQYRGQQYPDEKQCCCQAKQLAVSHRFPRSTERHPKVATNRGHRDGGGQTFPLAGGQLRLRTRGAAWRKELPYLRAAWRRRIEYPIREPIIRGENPCYAPRCLSSPCCLPAAPSPTRKRPATASR